MFIGGIKEMRGGATGHLEIGGMLSWSYLVVKSLETLTRYFCFVG